MPAGTSKEVTKITYVPGKKSTIEVKLNEGNPEKLYKSNAQFNNYRKSDIPSKHVKH